MVFCLAEVARLNADDCAELKVSSEDIKINNHIRGEIIVRCIGCVQGSVDCKTGTICDGLCQRYLNKPKISNLSY